MPPAGGLTTAELKTYVGSVSAQTPDTYLEQLLNGAFGMAQRLTKRRLEPLPATSGSPEVVVAVAVDRRRFTRVPDVRVASTVVLDGAVVTDYELRRQPSDQSPAPIMRLATRGTSLQITGRFGFEALPAELEDAIYTHAARMLHERTALYADVTGSEEYGTQTYLRRLPARVADVYNAYRVASDRWGLA